MGRRWEEIPIEINMIVDWKKILLKPSHPPIPNVRARKDDTLYFDSLTKGTLMSGDPGTGKTTTLAMMLIDYALKYPNRPIFVLDASESLTNEFIELYHGLPPEDFAKIDWRFVLDLPGHPEYALAKPMFSSEYGLSDEELVQKAQRVIEELNSAKLSQTPMMASAITSTAPHLFRLIQAIKNDDWRSWQITEAKRLLIDSYEGGELGIACKKYGQFVPDAKWYLEKVLLREKLTPQGREASTKSLIDALSVIEPKPLRARYGTDKPGVTVQEVIEKSLIYFVGGSALNNQKNGQAFVFWDEYMSLKSIINKRTPHDDNDVPVLLVIDEVYQLFKIPGMAEEIGQISAYYRSRKLQLIMVIQAFWQLDEVLKDQIWNLGNLVTFALGNHDDAYKFSQQAFKYDQRQEKMPARSEGGQPILETDRGQYLTEADWIQNLGWRQMVMRRYINERERESFVTFIKRTRDKPQVHLAEPLESIKERLFKRRAIPIREALREINQRKITFTTKRPSIKTS